METNGNGYRMSDRQGAAIREAFDKLFLVNDSMKQKYEVIEDGSTPFLDGVFAVTKGVQDKLSFALLEDVEEFEARQKAMQPEQKTEHDSRLLEKLGQVEMDLILTGDFVSLVKHSVSNIYAGLSKMFPDMADVGTCEGALTGLDHIKTRLKDSEDMMVGLRKELLGIKAAAERPGMEESK